MHFSEKIMHYCIFSLIKNNNEILQYWIIINDIALLMHYRALLQCLIDILFKALHCVLNNQISSRIKRSYFFISLW